jgi:hypothetical protein
MKPSLFPGTQLSIGSLLLWALVPSTAWGQGVDRGVREAYFRSVADHFQVPLEEVSILGDWDMAEDEVPVVLFLSRKAGVSPDVLMAVRKSGRSWHEVASRFGLRARTFHIPLPEGVQLGPLSRPYAEFETRPAKEWDQIHLDDLQIICLVNLRVLSEQVGVPPLRVLRSMEEAGSFVAGFASLLGRTVPR